MNTKDNKLLRENERFFQQNFAGENALLDQVRSALITPDILVTIPEKLTFDYNYEYSQLYITMFEARQKPLRWGAKLPSLQQSINHIITRLKEQPRYKYFSVDDPSRCRIMLEIVTEEYPCKIRNMTTLRFSPNRFEAGITGLKYRYKGTTRYFMPTDSVTYSIMSVKQVLNFLSKKTGVAKMTKSINERVHLMRREPIEYAFIKSTAFITYHDKVLPLHRGYPMPVEFSVETLHKTLFECIDWLVRNMRKDGSFLYYYDGINDTEVDFLHPKMVDPLYNNILRHSGGTITLLRGYELSKNKIYLNAAKDSIDFFISTLQSHQYKNEYACYPFFNKKSKLGGAGVGLVALMHYYIQTDSECYRKEIDGLVRHILSRIEEDGEMIGYYIHPLYNNSKALIHLSPSDKKSLFSFYYPGEALLGLALYYRHIKDIDSELQKEVVIKSRLALDFLVDIRPVKYKELFLELPADAWLMQAIEEWYKVKEFQKKSYLDFVFNDAQTMMEHMYTPENAPYFDYIGGFYYNYGDHVYHDASRCEGVIAAYFLANTIGDDKRVQLLKEGILHSAKGLLYTYHSDESTYAHFNPSKSRHSFRFKLTRQWVRVDSIQHTACFLSRLCMSNLPTRDFNGNK